MRINVRRASLKILTVLVRAVIIFFGLSLFIHFYKYDLPNLMKNEPMRGGALMLASVFIPMFLEAYKNQKNAANKERGKQA